VNTPLQFSIAEMQETYATALKYQETYTNALESLKKEIEHLSNNWVSDETGTYEAFKEKFDEKLVRLEEARDMMKEFCNQLEIKMQEFQDAATTAKNAFE